MQLSRALRLLRALAPLACGAGCFGGQGTDEGEECRYERAELGEDEVSPALGFAPSDVLSWAGGARSVSARWNGPPGGTTASSRPGPVEVVVAIERAPAAAFEVIPANGCGLPHLRIPVTVGLQSVDGQLDERWAGAMTAARSGFARVSADIDLERLQGDFEWRSVTPRVGLVQPTLSFVMTRAGSAGSFGAGLEMRSASSVSIGPGDGGGRVLTWPADSPCGSEYVGREPLEQEAVYVDAIAHAATSTWSDARGTEHALSITSADLLCEPEQGEPALRTNLALRSADGVFDLTLAAWFVRNGDQLEYDRTHARGLEGSPATFVERFGDFGLDLTGYEHVSLALALTLSATGGHATFAIVGYRDECQPRCDARGCSGCGPLTRTTLHELSLSQRP